MDYKSGPPNRTESNHEISQWKVRWSYTFPTFPSPGSLSLEKLWQSCVGQVTGGKPASICEGISLSRVPPPTLFSSQPPTFLAFSPPHLIFSYIYHLFSSSITCSVSINPQCICKALMHKKQNTKGLARVRSCTSQFCALQHAVLCT